MSAEYPGPLRPDLVLKGKQDEWAKVAVYHDAFVSCKGEVMINGKHPDDIRYDGCGWGDGECDLKAGPWVIQYMRQETPQPDAPGGPVDAIVVLTQPMWGMYYHFVVDSLSRIGWMYEQYPEVVADPKTYFHTGFVLAPAQMWAKLVGIKSSLEDTRLLDGWWKAKTVYFPPSNACANNKVGAEPKAITWMNQKVQQTVTSMASEQKVYCENFRAKGKLMALLVRRDGRKAKARSVDNDEEVITELRKLPGWEVYVFTDYPKSPPIFDTCAAFYCADMILGPCGAGFANLVCARRGVPLVEFQQKPHSPDFELLAMKLGLPYFGCTGTFDHDWNGDVNMTDVLDALPRALSYINGSVPPAAIGGKPSIPEPVASTASGGANATLAGHRAHHRHHNWTAAFEAVSAFELNIDLPNPSMELVVAVGSFLSGVCVALSTCLCMRKTYQASSS